MAAVLKVKLWLAGAPGGWWPEPREESHDIHSTRPRSRSSSTEFSWTPSSEASSRPDATGRGLNATFSPHSPALRERTHDSSPLGTIRVQYASSDDDDDPMAQSMASLSIQESSRKQPGSDDSNPARPSADDVTPSEEGEGPRQETHAAAQTRRSGDARAFIEPAQLAPTLQRRSRAERAARNASWSRPVPEQASSLTPQRYRRNEISSAPKFWTPVFFESYPSAETMARVHVSFAQAAAEYQEDECSETERQVLEVVRRNRNRRQVRERVRRLRIRRDREALANFRNQARAARRLANDVDQVIEQLARVAQAEPPRGRRRRAEQPARPHGYPIAVHAHAPPAVENQPVGIINEVIVDPQQQLQGNEIAALQENHAPEHEAVAGPPPSAEFAEANQAHASEQAAVTGPPSPTGFAAASQADAPDQAAIAGSSSPAALAGPSYVRVNTPEEDESTNVVYDPANFAMWTRPSSRIEAVPSPADSSTRSGEVGMYLVNPHQLLRDAEEDLDLFQLLGQPAPSHGAPTAARAHDGDLQAEPSVEAQNALLKELESRLKEIDRREMALKESREEAQVLVKKVKESMGVPSQHDPEHVQAVGDPRKVDGPKRNQGKNKHRAGRYVQSKKLNKILKQERIANREAMRSLNHLLRGNVDQKLYQFQQQKSWNRNNGYKHKNKHHQRGQGRRGNNNQQNYKDQRKNESNKKKRQGHKNNQRP
ncbi:hypothetical protein QAD02_005043 [Eretmocerus hayati]|uniref:Uncharacterized protein n=1 Tax=Eretmocerus hayati TaxID=131215 RepID=A0ACC2NT51_9HYME|nr:hypothetical protein QAD02_005043 [Eretmocerus hayati]